MTQTRQPRATTALDSARLMGLIHEQVKSAQGDLGRFNLLVVGNTGAGKSTLINAIFGWDIARTGNGRPVTQGTVEYSHPNLPLSIFDTRGIEVGENSEDLTGRLVDEIQRRRHLPVTEQVHVVWYAVRWSDRRLEDGQIAAIDALAGAGVPVILVLTQVPRRDSVYHPDAIAFLDALTQLNLPLTPRPGIVMTAAIDDPWLGESHGLHHLLDTTFRVAPKGTRSALIAAQQIDVQKKRDESWNIIVQHAAMASGAALTPIPFGDAVAIVPIQVSMIARITSIWGLDIATTVLVSTIASALLASGATFIGRELIGNALKLIPGVGTLLGGVLNATVAGAVTTGIGTAWASLVERFAANPDQVKDMTGSEVRRAFEAQLRATKNSVARAESPA